MNLVEMLEIDVSMMMSAVDNKTAKQMKTMIGAAADAFDNSTPSASYYINTLKAAQRVARNHIAIKPTFRKG